MSLIGNRHRSGRLGTASLPLSPRRRRRLGGLAIDRIGLQQAHRFFDRAFELRVVTRDYVLREVLDVDIGRDAFVLDRPLPFAREKAAAGAIIEPPSTNVGVSAV